MATPLYSQQPRRPAGGSGTAQVLVPGSLLEFKAGRMFRDGDSRWVRPDTTKGVCYIKRSSDGIPRFGWRNRETNRDSDELILLPGDFSLEKVAQSADRVYMLKFKSSAQRNFYWMQEADASNDDKLIRAANALLNVSSDFDDLEDDLDDDDEAEDEEGAGGMGVPPLVRRNSREAEVLSRHREQSALARESPGMHASLSSAQVGGVPGGNLRRASRQPGDDVTPLGGSTGDQLNSLRQLISGISVPDQRRHQRGVQLGDVLTRENLAAVLADERLRRTLFPTLPENMPRDAAALEQVVASPQFRQALGSLSYVLESGQMAPLVGQLGLGPEASTSVEAFLRAIQEQADAEGDGSAEDEDRDAEMH
ncbi:hypothetical protein LPJ53_001761 [Coemansia erecta]|uniref:Adhesion regulating molecule n=1 Tax=Coemansia erecta TaxID=147472 RepID=A0A9W7Y4N4_9FUNG|nr:hypothetical protein LPJ53_001761 [Coemansia erecta]